MLLIAIEIFVVLAIILFLIFLIRDDRRNQLIRAEEDKLEEEKEKIKQSK